HPTRPVLPQLRREHGLPVPDDPGLRVLPEQVRLRRHLRQLRWQHDDPAPDCAGLRLLSELVRRGVQLLEPPPRPETAITPPPHSRGGGALPGERPSRLPLASYWPDLAKFRFCPGWNLLHSAPTRMGCRCALSVVQARCAE